jgi:hypothetical protein
MDMDSALLDALEASATRNGIRAAILEAYQHGQAAALCEAFGIVIEGGPVGLVRSLMDTVARVEQGQ